MNLSRKNSYYFENVMTFSSGSIKTCCILLSNSFLCPYQPKKKIKTFHILPLKQSCVFANDYKSEEVQVVSIEMLVEMKIALNKR